MSKMSDVHLQLQELDFEPVFLTFVVNGRPARTGSVVWCDQLDQEIDQKRKRR